MNTFDWTRQRVIITGGSGFVGRHLEEHLWALGAQVIALSGQTYDLRRNEDARRLFIEMPVVTMVIHLAATVGGIGANRTSPGKMFYDNLLMGTQLLEQARLAGVPKFVGIGTICSYPKDTPVPFREDDLWNGYPEATNAPYGLAKKMLLVQSQAYRAEYGYNAIYLMPTNLYGEGDNFNAETSHVIPAIIRKMHEAKLHGADSVTLWGDGTPTREFLYVQDAVEGIAMAAQHYNDGEPVNLGSGMEISIAELAQRIAGIVSYEGAIVWDTRQPNGQPRRCLDTTRAEREFGFRAKTSLEDGLRATVQAYLAEASQEAAR